MKKKNRLIRVSYLLALFIALGLGIEARAATVTAIASGQWTAAAATVWSTGAIPANGDDIIIPTGITVTIEAAPTTAPKTITIEGTGSLTWIAGNWALNVATTAAGGIYVNGTSASALAVVGTPTITVGSTTYRGDITNTSTGTINLTGATLNISGSITNGDDATITTTATTALNFIGITDCTVPSDITAANTLTVNKTGASVYLSAALTLNTTLTMTSGTLVVGNNNLTVTTNTTVASGSTLNASSTVASNRTFTGTTGLTGTAVLDASGTSTNVFTGIVTLGAGSAGSILNLEGSTSSIAAVPVFTNAAIINAKGASITYTGGAGLDLSTNATFQTNLNTDLTINSATATVTGFPVITELKNLNLTAYAASTITLQSNLTLAGNFTLSTTAVAKVVSTGGYNLTVNGTFTNGNATTEGTLNIGAGTLTLNGPVASWGFDQLALVIGGGSLVIGGSGALAALPANTAAATDHGTVTMNRPGANLSFAAELLGAVGLDALTITSGTVTAPNAGISFTVTGACAVGANGTLNTNGCTATIFVGAVSGTGTITANAAADDLEFRNATFTFSGTLTTAATTVISFSTVAVTATLPASVTALEELRLVGLFNHVITLSNNLTLNDALVPSAAGTVLQQGSIVVNGYNLTLTGGVSTGAAAASLFIDARNSSTLTLGAASEFTNLRVKTDETTNISVTGATTAFNTNATDPIISCKNLIVAGGATTLTAGLTVNGNLDVIGTLDKATFNLTVYGDVSNTGTMTLSGAGGIIYVYGQMSGSGTYTTAATAGTTQLYVKGTGAQLSLPSGFTSCLNFYVDRASGVKLNANLTIGAAAVNGLLTLNKGNLDLNGYIVTLADVAGGAGAQLSEVAGYHVINTGASSATTGYITTGALAIADASNSGIGITGITGGTLATIKRYVKSTPIAGVGISTARSYHIVNTGANLTAMNLYFDNTELNSPATGLKLYFSTLDAFTINTEVTGTIYPNTPTGKGYLAVTGLTDAVATDYFYTTSGLPGTGGVLYTYTGATGGNWSTASNWSPNGVPTNADQVSINGPLTVYLNGTGSTFECNKLILNHNAAKIAPYNNAVNGDIVSLRVLGNVTVNSGEILGVNGFGRLNLIIGDGTTAGVSSVITAPGNYVNGQGIWVNDLTVNSASVTTSAHDIRVSGNLSLVGNSSMVLSQPIFYGNNLAQTISVVPSAYLQIGTSWFTNSASVTTTSNFEVANTINVAAGSSFIANNGLAIFPSTNITCWNVQTGATLRLNDVEFNDNSAATDYTPVGIVEIQGSFTKSGQSGFTATSGNVLFRNSSQKQLVNTGLAADLRFYDLTVFTNSSVATSSSFEVANMIDVKTGASLTGDNGTINFTQAAPATKWIKNASDHTLEFYNLTLTAGTTTTNDSWKIKGDLTGAGGTLQANNGTVTFLNTQSKTITKGAGTLNFFKLLVADASTVVTAAAAQGDMTISNNSTYLTGSGIEVAGTGSLTMDAAATLTFDAAVGVTTGYPKVITKSTAGTLKMGLMVINASPANDVTTASDFTIIGTTTGFTNSGAGGNFAASAGTVTFSGTAPVIANVSPGESSFFSVRTIGPTVLTQTAAQAIHIKGNITTDEQSKFVPAAATSKIYLDGSAQQILGGSSSIVNPIQLAQVVLDKGTGLNTTNDEVLLQADVLLNGAVSSALTLTNGVLNLGSKKFTNGAIVMSRTNGVINGGTGTYLITTGHETPLLEDAFFMVGGVPTLYNLQIDAAHTTANDLTINGALNLNLANLTIADGSGVTAPKKVIVYGNLSRVNGAIAGSPTVSRLVLKGTGTVTGGLSNTFFNGAAATTVQLEVARAEVLGSNLTIANTSYLLVNSGINDFDLGANTLTFTTTFNLNVISGGIKAGLNSTFVIPTASTLPASTFRNNEVYNITLNGDLTLTSDLQINGVWTNTSASDVITGDNNVLTIGQLASLPVLTSAAYVKGNMARYVTSIATPFNLGDASQYYPVTLQFSTIGSSQLVRVYARNVDPVIGRGGNAKNSVNAQWTMVPQGTETADSLKVTFQWPSTYEYTGGAGQVALANSVFPAKWEATYWKDYRNNLSNFAVASPRVLTMTGFPVANPSALNGVWAVFAAAANTTVEKDRAIATSGNKIVITSVEPSPTKLNQATKVSVQLQNQYGQPVLADTTFNVTLKLHQGTPTLTALTNVIAKGSSIATFSGVTFTTTAGKDCILIADTTGGSANWQPITSDPFVVLDVDPATQANTITFTNVEATSMTATWVANTATDPTIIVMKADTLLLDSEFPVDGVTYDANSIYGAGSSIGNAIVAYKGTATSVNVTGLAPNTKYYVYAFSYKGAGYENYRTTATSKNPNAQTTTGTSDDDVTYGTNDTRSTSKTIGTNTPVTGTMKSVSDADWFNFTLTGASPNLRAKLYNVPGNYTLELYDMTGRRIRRSTLNGKLSEAMVVNNLTPGTYTVKIFSQDGSYWTKSGDEYKIKVSTFSSEIFSVTP